MMREKRHWPFYTTVNVSLWCVLSSLLSSVANAQTPVPGPAEIGRIKPEEAAPPPDRVQDEKVVVPRESAPTMPIPEGAKNIQFMMRGVSIEGVTAFEKEQFADIYTPYLNKEVTLDIVYMIAGVITERYRNAGYFLSLAYIPNQRIADGIITIKVVEGYIGEVEVKDEAEHPSIIQQYINKLTAKKPIKADELESFLLRLNDLPGFAFTSVLSPMESKTEGAVKLTLFHSEKPGSFSFSFDNYSSRFLGPNEASASYSTSLFAMHQTSFYGLSSLPSERLNYFSLNHGMMVAPDLLLDFAGSLTNAAPAYTLEPFDVESSSAYLSASLSWQWIRQRQMNLAFKLMLDGRNTNSDLLNAAFTRDRIRALRFNTSYDGVDSWDGYTAASATFSRGLKLFGASREGEIYLSRAEAKPDFTKLELSFSRLQAIGDEWQLFSAIQGQYATIPLFSSEEFGYGGQSFGRAFDASEITGDHGVAASVEVRYNGWENLEFAEIQPYAFYDIGKIWNKDTAQIPHESRASAGFGFRFILPWSQSGNLGLAWPLTRELASPIYGTTKQGPRLLLQINQEY